MIHVFIFYITFYIFTRFQFVYPSKNKVVDERDEVISWFAVWPFALESFTLSWIGFEFYDYLNGEKTSNEE